MADQPLRMFGYWEEKKGLKTAVQEYYPQVFRSDPVLYMAWTQIQTAEAALRQRIKELELEEPEEN